MIPHFTISRSSNRISRSAQGACVFVGAFCFVLLASSGANAQFKSDRDRKIVHDILSVFGRECVQHEASDGEVIGRLEVEAKDANRRGNVATQKCFENHYSQVSGVFYLYQKICRDISSTQSDISDDIAADQLLEVNKYQQGIRPYHSTLNDCLASVPDRKGLPYVVPLAGLDLDVRALQWELDQIRIGDPFANTFPVPRKMRRLLPRHFIFCRNRRASCVADRPDRISGGRRDGFEIPIQRIL